MKKLVLCTLIFSFLVNFQVTAKVISPFGQNNLTVKSFYAKQDGNSVRLSWELETEHQDLSGHLERSDDGSNFKRVYNFEIKSGRTDDAFVYMDNSLKSGKYFYRLIITKNLYDPFISHIVSVAFSKDESSGNYYAITQGDMLINLRFNTIGRFVANVTDIQGRIKWRNVFADQNKISIATSTLSNGIYILRIYEAESKKSVLTRFMYKF